VAAIRSLDFEGDVAMRMGLLRKSDLDL
jgi:hypothetical protein